MLTESHIHVIKEVKNFIDAEPQMRVSVDRFVEMSRLSEDKLTKGFKELFGVSLYQYQLKQAMQYAASLLRKGFQVKAVAIELGYHTSGSFTRAFIHQFGCPPTAIKNEKTQQ